MKVFVGWDAREQLAWHVCVASIMRHASKPLEILPVMRSQLGGIFTRPRAADESTEFAISRFLAPALSRYEGFSIFVDCDFLCRTDLARLSFDPGKAVSVVKHDYRPAQRVKMDGQVQTAYPRKNWSSFIVFNNEKCRDLTPSVVNEASGTYLHRFQWVADEQIGSIPKTMNYLVGEENQTTEPPAMIHWTNGGPWMEEYADVEYAELWRAERDHMLGRRKTVSVYACS